MFIVSVDLYHPPPHVFQTLLETTTNLLNYDLHWSLAHLRAAVTRGLHPLQDHCNICLQHYKRRPDSGEEVVVFRCLWTTNCRTRPLNLGTLNRLCVWSAGASKEKRSLRVSVLFFSSIPHVLLSAAVDICITGGVCSRRTVVPARLQSCSSGGATSVPPATCRREVLQEDPTASAAPLWLRSELTYGESVPHKHWPCHFVMSFVMSNNIWAIFSLIWRIFFNYIFRKL